MGKKSKYPDYSTGTITVNGRTVASTTRDKNNNIVGSSYNMTNNEKKIYDSIQSNYIVLCLVYLILLMLIKKRGTVS